MQDIVVIGYGTQRKSDVTGALSRITADVIQERPAQNVLQAIQGKASGVQVSSNMKPGELPIVRVRGNRSLGASNDPLYVIDGIPLVNSLGVNSFTMSDLNPNDIASIEILKDASSTAIYGSRGANGVILITTKKGKKGKVNVSYNASYSFDSYKSLTNWMDGGEYVDRWRASLMNGRTYNPSIPNNGNLNVPAVMWYPSPKYDSVMIGASDAVATASVMKGYEWNPDGTVKMRNTTPAEIAMGWPAQVPIYNSKNIGSYDWLKDAVRTGVTQNHQISLTSGNDITRFSMSLGYYDQKGVQKDQDYKRFTANIGGEKSLGDVVSRLKSISYYLRLGGIIFVSALGLTSFVVLLIIVTMRMNTRKGEVEILSLIGATPSFVRSPIILEGIIYSVFGVLVGWITSLIMWLYVAPSILTYFGNIPVLPQKPVDFFILFAIIFSSSFFLLPLPYHLYT